MEGESSRPSRSRKQKRFEGFETYGVSKQKFITSTPVDKAQRKLNDHFVGKNDNLELGNESTIAVNSTLESFDVLNNSESRNRGSDGDSILSVLKNVGECLPAVRNPETFDSRESLTCQGRVKDERGTVSYGRGRGRRKNTALKIPGGLNSAAEGCRKVLNIQAAAVVSNEALDLEQNVRTRNECLKVTSESANLKAQSDSASLVEVANVEESATNYKKSRPLKIKKLNSSDNKDSDISKPRKSNSSQANEKQENNDCAIKMESANRLESGNVCLVPVTVKRGRGRGRGRGKTFIKEDKLSQPSKTLNEDLKTKDAQQQKAPDLCVLGKTGQPVAQHDGVPSGTVKGGSRGRGRGRGRARKDISDSPRPGKRVLDAGTDLEDGVRSSGRKRKRCNYADMENSDAVSSDESPNELPEMQARKGRQSLQKDENEGGPSKVRGEKSQKEPIKCLLCEKVVDSESSIRQHMMYTHALLWSRQRPEGEDNPYLLIKKIGVILCPKCLNKKFKNPQYYKHHKIWCGREDEMIVCKICEKTMRAMWEAQHMQEHRRKARHEEEQSRKEEEKKRKNMEEEKEEHYERKDEDEKGTLRRKTKRKAAKSALTIMNRAAVDIGDEEGQSSGDDFKVGEGDSSSEDNDDEGEEAVEEDLSDACEGQEKLYTYKLPSAKRKKITAEDDEATVARTLWSNSIISTKTLPVDEKLQRILQFLDVEEESVLFPHLQPVKEEWYLISEEDREKYIPPLSESVAFASHSSGSNTPLTTPKLNKLKWGHNTFDGEKLYCFTGGPIWSMEWCPLPNGSDPQVVAVISDETTSELPGCDKVYNGQGLVQFWAFSGLSNQGKESSLSTELKICLAHEAGYVRSIAWCPKGCYQNQPSNADTFSRLGLLAVAGSCGSIFIYSIPQVNSLPRREEQFPPVFKPKPSLTLVTNRLAVSPCLSVSWQPTGQHSRILAGFGSGDVFVWDLTKNSTLLWVSPSMLRPVRLFKAHINAVMACSWSPSVADTFVTTCMSKLLLLWHLNNPSCPVYEFQKRYIICRSVSWAGPLSWGFFSAGEQPHPSSNTSVFLHLSNCHSLESPRYAKAVNVSHAACVTDITYSPLFEVLAVCDVAGQVSITLLNIDVAKKGRRLSRDVKSKRIPSTILYQAKLQDDNVSVTDAEKMSVFLERVNTSKDTDDNDKELDARAACNASQDDMLKGSMGDNSSPKMLCFHNCRMNADEIVKKSQNMKPAKEILSTNAAAIHRVRINPNASCCLWLLSGGQAGILRLENLHDLIAPHRKDVCANLGKRSKHTREPNP